MSTYELFVSNLSLKTEDSDDGKAIFTKVHYWELCKYASKFEMLLFFIGISLSVLVGCAMPLSILLFADLLDNLVVPIASYNTFTNDKIQTIIQRFAILGSATFFVAYFQMFCTQLAAKMQARRIRRLFFSQILKQDVAWFDIQNIGGLITHLTEGVDKIEAGLGEKLGIFIQSILVFLSGIIIGFTKNWELALVASAVFPFVVLSVVFYSCVVQKYTVKEREAYSRANGIASEVLGAIKTIFAFEGQEKELQRYSSELHTAEKIGIKKSTLIGLVYGSIDASIYVLISVTIYYGIMMLTQQESSAGNIVLVVFAMLFGGITIGQAFQQLEHFSNAAISAAEIFAVIDRVPPIDKLSSGKELNDLKGDIVFKNVSFEYPKRLDVKVLNGFNLIIPAGKTIAIVGPSGSGKSTVIQLLQRFYDPDIGEVLIDGENIRDLDLAWFRSQLGVVSQEPILFAGTIAENIRFGRPEATLGEIEEVAKIARAHDFICKLPEAYDTFVAEGGSGMSGGQKQRLAIARALIRNPRILLLDEATSALDTRSEKAVQRALDSAKKGRTVVIVAHRLSTIRDADTIFVVDRGQVKEKGTHEELLAIKGIYAKLVQKSETPDDNSASDDDTDDDDDVTTILKGQANIVKDEYLNSLPNVGINSDDEESSVVSFVTSASNVSILGLDSANKINVGKEVLSANKPEMWFLVVGCLMSVVSGLVQSSFTIVYTEIYDILNENNSTDQLQRTAVVSGAMGGLAILRLLGFGIGGYCLGVAGERLTKRCRTLLFKAMLRQEVGWFDEQPNQPGVLTGRLAADVPMLQNISGRRLGSMIEMLVLIIASLTIAFYYSWQIALVCLAYFPILVIAAAFDMQQWNGETSRVNMRGAGLANECFSAARTVFSLGAEEQFIEKYTKQALLTNTNLLKSVAKYALVSAIANSLMSFEMAGVFYAGSILIQQEKLTLLQVFRSYTAISFAASNLGSAASFAPDSKKAQVAATHIFELIKREPTLLPEVGAFPETPFKGQVAFHEVSFRYPTRQNTQVLKSFDYEVPMGKCVALVGQSGCGKSTVLQLVQRFYDPSVGPEVDSMRGVTFDGINLQTLAPNWIRRQIGVVSQEPNLIDMSIEENIAYGLNYLDEAPLMEVIIDAAKQANAHTFIMNLPQGYATMVGPRGSHLSGGQKQRVAIARALIRNPCLLLLDEATAALDNESERVVQSALDAVMKTGSRTTLVVAHRLTTVGNCDLIAVLDGGRCVESGAPDELMQAKGKFYELNTVDVNIKEA